MEVDPKFEQVAPSLLQFPDDSLPGNINGYFDSLISALKQLLRKSAISKVGEEELKCADGF